jgi:hypothetical protein
MRDDNEPGFDLEAVIPASAQVAIDSAPRDREALWDELYAVDAAFFSLLQAVAALARDGIVPFEPLEELVESAALTQFTDGNRATLARIWRVDERVAVPGHGADMKLKKHTVDFELPTIEDLTRNLDARSIFPQLSAAEEALAKARAHLEAARSEAKTLAARAEHLAFEVAQSGVGAADYDRARADLGRAESLIPVFERCLDLAASELATAQVNAREACHAEVRRRQDVLNQAGAVLLTELAKLDAFEAALANVASMLPSTPGAGLLYVGSFRDQAMPQPVMR